MTLRILAAVAILLGTNSEGDQGTVQEPSLRQDRPESAILRRAAAAVRESEPKWRFVAGILNAPPLMAEQLGAAAGGWYHSLDDPSMGVTVRVHHISTAEAASGFLSRQAHGEVARGWTVTRYELGDGANMATFVDPALPATYNLTFRKGPFLAHLGGRSKDSVEHFAEFVLAAMPD